LDLEVPFSTLILESSLAFRFQYMLIVDNESWRTETVHRSY
jgi:hypothetical protein